MEVKGKKWKSPVLNNLAENMLPPAFLLRQCKLFCDCPQVTKVCTPRLIALPASHTKKKDPAS